MLEVSENLTLLQESTPRLFARQPLLDELDRHLLLELPIYPIGEVDNPHTAFTEFGKQAVGTDDSTLQDVRRRAFDVPLDSGEERRRALDGRCAEKRVRRGSRRKQFCNFPLQYDIAVADVIQVPPALVARQLQDRIEDRGDALPPLSFGGRFHESFSASLSATPDRGRLEPSASRVGRSDS